MPFLSKNIESIKILEVIEPKIAISTNPQTLKMLKGVILITTKIYRKKN